MNEEQWSQYEKLYKDYEEARGAYESAQMNLRGAFSEMAREYKPGSLEENRLYEEEKAHERFVEKRRALHAFIKGLPKEK